MAIQSSERLLTVKEVAELLRIHPVTVRRQIKAGKLRVVRIGRSIRVRRAEVDLLTGPPYKWPPTAEEIERRKVIGEEMRRARDSGPLLGISTTELVRLARGDAAWPEYGPSFEQGGPPSREEAERRWVAGERLLAIRGSTLPVDTTKLVRESRRALEKRNERWLKRSR